MPESYPLPRVLSIQSHVVSGYCGNKCATFPLQLLGFEVDVINSVHLSNHTNYKTTRGQIFDNNDLAEIYKGLEENKLLPLYDYILTGYIANVGYIETLAKMIFEIKQERRQSNQDCWYTFDPVLGDDGIGYYVPKGDNIVTAYKRHLLPLADIITPNRFEASILTGIDIDTDSNEALKQACEAIRVFHTMGIKIVIITSLELPGHKDKLTCLLSGIPQDEDSDHHEVDTPVKNNSVWLIQVPKLDALFCGTGDLFAALITGWLHKTNFDLKKSLENTINSLNPIIEETFKNCSNSKDPFQIELRLIANQGNICKPIDKFTAEKVDLTSIDPYL